MPFLTWIYCDHSNGQTPRVCHGLIQKSAPGSSCFMGSDPTCPARIGGAVMRVGGLEAPLHLLQQLPDFVIQPLREFGGQLWRENPPNVKATPASGSASVHRAHPAGAQPGNSVCNQTGLCSTRPEQLPTASSPQPRSPARPRRSSRWPRTCRSPRTGWGAPAAPS